MSNQKNSTKDNVLNEFTLRFLNMGACAVIAFFLFDFAFAPWSWNPIDNLLYVRSDGLILPANHISSALAVTITAAFYSWRDFNHAAKLMFLIFSTASIHEYILDAMNIPAMIAAHTLGYTITFRWFFWLGFFLVPGIFFATKWQRKRLLLIALFCAAYIGSWILMATTFNIDTYTILYYAPGPAYRDFIPNFFEVSSWVIPSLMWWIR